MSTELALPLEVAPRGAIAPAQDRLDQREMIETIKQTVCKGASDAQLRLFIEVCRSTGLNPFIKGEIWYVAEKGIIMAGRDGYLRVANENPNFDGMKTVVERDAKNQPISATCTVWRKDRSHPIECTAFFSEYNKQSPVWKQYPSAMIQKVAEVLALKRSFAINGVVTEEEIGNDGAGSREAAQEVARQKLAGEVPLITAEPVDETTQEAISEEPRPGRNRRVYDKYVMLKAVKEVKGRFQKLNLESEYRAILQRFGVEKSNQLRDDDGGTQARSAYKAMGSRIAELESEDNEAFEGLQNFADWPDDPLAPALGRRIVVDGKRYRRADDISDWKPVVQ